MGSTVHPLINLYRNHNQNDNSVTQLGIYVVKTSETPVPVEFRNCPTVRAMNTNLSM